MGNAIGECCASEKSNYAEINTKHHKISNDTQEQDISMSGDDLKAKSARRIQDSWSEKKQKDLDKKERKNKKTIFEEGLERDGARHIDEDEVKERTAQAILRVEKELHFYSPYSNDQIENEKEKKNKHEIFTRKPILFSDGTIYHGQWSYAGYRYEGFGYLIKQDGSKMEGLWNNGDFIRGRIFQTNGSYYEGDVVYNEAHGNGKFYGICGLKYAGEWRNGRKDGTGIIVYNDETEYHGEFHNDTFNGRGKMRWQDGHLYVGNFYNSMLHGDGAMTIPEGKVYEGTFHYNHIDGNGRLILGEEKCYIGDFKKGKKEGKGTYYFNRSNYYEGHWKGDKAHGHGKYIIDDSVVVEGNWRFGKLVQIIKKESSIEQDFTIHVETVKDTNTLSHLRVYEEGKGSPSKFKAVNANEKMFELRRVNENKDQGNKDKQVKEENKEIDEEVVVIKSKGVHKKEENNAEVNNEVQPQENQNNNENQIQPENQPEHEHNNNCHHEQVEEVKENNEIKQNNEEKHNHQTYEDPTNPNVAHSSIINNMIANSTQGAGTIDLGDGEVKNDNVHVHVHEHNVNEVQN
jgi:hypothetical protein